MTQTTSDSPTESATPSEAPPRGGRIVKRSGASPSRRESAASLHEFGQSFVTFATRPRTIVSLSVGVLCGALTGWATLDPESARVAFNALAVTGAVSAAIWLFVSMSDGNYGR